MMIKPSTSPDLAEKTLSYFVDTGQSIGLPESDSITAADIEKLTAKKYIEKIHVLFSDLTETMAQHNVPIDDEALLYDPSPGERSIFEPTALRQVLHFYSTYVQSLEFLAHPTLDFNSNLKEITHADDRVAAPAPELMEQLAYNLQQTHLSIDVFQQKISAADPVQKQNLQERFILFQTHLVELTEKFCADNDLPLQLTSNQNPAAQTASSYKPPARTL